MSGIQLLQLGRTIGLNNVRQIGQFARALRNGAEEATMHLNYSTAGAQKMLQDNPFVDQKALAQIQELCPQDARNILDVLFRRYGDKSGKVAIKALTQNANGANIAEGAVNVLANSSGMKMSVNGTSSLFNAAGDFDMYLGKGAQDSKSSIVKELVEKIKYLVNGDIAELTISPVRAQGVAVKANVKANKSFYDGVANAVTGGKYKDYGELIETGKKALAQQA